MDLDTLIRLDTIEGVLRDLAARLVRIEAVADIHEPPVEGHRVTVEVPAVGAGETGSVRVGLGQRCHADRDGDCVATDCPQLRDGEPARSGRHCPLDHWWDED